MFRLYARVSGNFKFLCLSVGILAMGAMAATGAQATEAQATENPAPPIEVYERPDKFVDKDDYVEPNLANLSKLMWALGVFQPDNTQAIDHYLQINECNLYQRFFTHDLEWTRIRQATREYLDSNTTSFPRQFEVIVPIELERYNAREETFSLSPKSSMDKVRRLRVSTNMRTIICNERSFSLPDYPAELILILNRPFTLDKIPVSRELAALYLEEIRREIEDLPARVRHKAYERIAYLRAKVKIITFKEMVKERSEPIAVVYAELDGIEVYADPGKIKLLYSEQVKKKSLREIRRERMHNGGEEDKITFGNGEGDVIAP